MHKKYKNYKRQEETCECGHSRKSHEYKKLNIETAKVQEKIAHLDLIQAEMNK